MLKRFFICMLGTMAGLWLSLFFLIIISLIAIGILAGKALSSDSVNYDKAVLKVELSGEINEYGADFSATDLIMNRKLNDALSLADILTAIRKAADDKKIQGIFLDCKGSALGIASREEMIEALNEFKKSGKWVIAYSDNYTQGDYYVATTADRVYVNPVGSIDVHGLGGTVIFYTDLLKKIGVEIEVLKVGAYKSAVEPFILTKMSEPAREQMMVYYNQIWGNMTEQMGANLDVAPEQLNQWADSITFTWNPEKYIDYRLAYCLKYRNEVIDAIKERMNVNEDDDLTMLSPSEYIDDISSKLFNGDGKHIAVLYAVGEISEDGTTGITSSSLVPEIQDLAKDDKVLGMVFRVNSPGGSAFASEQIWKALCDFKETGKPLYVSMGDYAASGGYYISCNADKIYADFGTLTGSIGIFGMIPNAQNLLTDKLGLHFETVETNKDSNFPAIYAPMTENQRSAMQSYIERGYDTFTKRVAEGRNISQDSVKVIGGGRVWDGKSALEIGLVDELGSLHTTIQALTKKLGLEEKDYVCYPTQDDKWMAILKSLGLDIDANINIEDLAPEELKSILMQARNIQELDPMQARMEYQIVNNF